MKFSRICTREMASIKSKAPINRGFQRTYKPIIIIMTRWHGINRCKRRLSKEIGSIQSAKIQEILTKNTIDVANELQRKGIAEIKLAVDGIGIKAANRWGKLNNINRISMQGGGNLGTKMRRQFLETNLCTTCSNQAKAPIIMIGSDLPTLTTLDLIQAVEILVHKEMVLGPSSDGGYWLIGLSKKLLNPVSIWPFSGINWGTNKVLKQTTQLANQNQINYQLIREQNDVDNLKDLSPWIKHKKFQLSALSFQP